ncbi:MAG: disulfide bond formation protein DsbC [Cycloclasticus sp. symbiont of Poecilosclerida sp. M]|nr:MAG: disulfide bond formation protein DsbC [Cycloclasticus sp. symbiont of Poecilosclerida sp. M]
MRKYTLICLLCCFYVSSAWADKQAIIKQLSTVLPGVSVDQISESPIKGLYQVSIGMRIVYVSADGRYILQGDMLDLKTRENLTESLQNKARTFALAKLDEKDMIVFPAKNEKHVVTVFSDIDCHYCRKLHAELNTYLDEGITVRYLFFPRSGINTPSYDKAVSVWCAKDRNQALTDAKLNDEVVAKTCKNPVKEQLELGVAMGVSGTPAIVAASGALIPGAVPAKDLIKYLNQ